MHSTTASIIARRSCWRQNSSSSSSSNASIVRVGGIVRQRFFMGNASSTDNEMIMMSSNKTLMKTNLKLNACTISSPFHTRTITTTSTSATQLYIPVQTQQKYHFGGLFLVNEKNHLRSNSIRREFSSTTTTADIAAAAEGDDGDDNNAGGGGKYAVIDHSEAYEMAMEGRHGQQLALARLEGIGKDDLPFDPFLEEEEQLLLEEERQQQQLLEADGEGEGELLSSNGENENKNSMKDADHDDDYDDEYDDEGDDFLDDDEEEDDDDDEEDENSDSIYNRDGSLRRKKSTLATLRAGYPSGGLFAVLEIVGSQHKVTTDDLLVVNRLQPVDQYKIGSVHTFGGEGDNSKNILLVGSSHLTIAGMPYVPGAEVDVMVEEITQDAKVIIFKKRRRKHSQRKNGFRRDLTLLRILDIRLPEQYKDHKYVGRDSVDELDNNELEDADNSPNTTMMSPSSENTVKFDNNEKESTHPNEEEGGQLKSAKQ
jgi:large subunit ribosomal protein L21